MKVRAMWNNDLVCGWESLIVIDDGHLALNLPEYNCCDMRGAIKIAKAICPLVWRIDAFSGGEPDTTYFIQGGKWVARDLRTKRNKNYRGMVIDSHLLSSK